MNLKSNIREGAIYATVWTLVALCILYAIACFANGFVWAATLSESYGLLVIRLVVSLFLGLVSLVALVFQHPLPVLYYLSNTILLVFPIAFIAGVLRSIYVRVRWGPTDSPDYETTIVGWIANLVFFGFVVYFLWQLNFDDTFAIDVISVVKDQAWLVVVGIVWVVATIFGTRE